MADTLSLDEIKTVTTLKRDAGRKFLAEKLGLQFDEDDDPQASIHVDYLYDNLMFMIQKGFPWGTISTLFTLVKCFLEESIGKTLPEAIKCFNASLQTVQDKISEHILKQFTDNFFATFMAHFKLYQYVFTQDRERLQIDLPLIVETPTDPVPFPQAIDVDVYEYEQKYKNIENKEMHTQGQRLTAHETSNQEDMDKLHNVLNKVNESESPLDREKILNIIHSVAEAQITCASHAIQQSIESTMEDLGFLLEKTALERPQALGAPPRFKTKTPLAGTPSGPKKTQSREKSGGKSRPTTKGSKR